MSIAKIDIKPIAVVMLMLLTSLAGCLDGGDGIVDEDVNELKANIETSTDDGNSSFTAKAIVAGGEEPYTFKWFLDGAEMLVMADTMSMSGLTTGQHSITLSVGSIDGQSIDINGVFIIAEPILEPEIIPEPVNTPPTCSITATAQVYEGEAADWDLEMQDKDGDNLTSIVEFGDGITSDQVEGNHSWTGHGIQTITATVIDSNSSTTTCQVSVSITENKTPVLHVSTSPVAEGTILVELESDVQLVIMTTDEENDDVSLSVDWGDGASTHDEEYPDHEYTEVGQYTITVSASDAFSTSQELLYVEVIAGFNDSAAFELYELQFSDDDPTEDLDANGDDTVDEAEDAEDEEGLDVDDTFAVDADGEANHDEGNIDAWQKKDSDDIGSVADSNDTAGSGRDSHDDDVLLNNSERTVENETEMESPIEDMDKDADIRDELFEGEDPWEMVKDEEAMEGEHYEALIDSVKAAEFYNSFNLDHDGDGTDDTECSQEAHAYWVDSDHDSNAERAILYRITYCLYNPNKETDSEAEITFVEVEALNWTDSNDDGTPEIVMALRTQSVTWSNNSHTRSDTTIDITVFAITDFDQDGNEEYLFVGALKIIHVDLNDDDSLEGEGVELNIAFAKDRNDDGTPEEALMMRMADMKLDLDGDSNVNTHVFYIQVVYVQDQDADGNFDRIRAAQFGGSEWDNNSDGIVDSKEVMWLGVGIRDTDFDGTEDRVTMALGYDVTIDSDGDGNAEKETSSFLASRVEDNDGDGDIDMGWYILASSERIDSDDNGMAESQTSIAAGAHAWDYDSDGNIERYVAIRYFSMKTNETNTGIFQTDTTAVWLLEVQDWNDDGSPNSIHAVKTISISWDNNSDGTADTYWNMAHGFYGQDSDSDGHWERIVMVEFTNAQSDDDADGNIEYSVSTHTFYIKHSSPLGMSHEWFYQATNSKSNVSVDGYAWYENSTVVAYESWDDTSTQETHAYVASYEYVDNGRDGSKEHEQYTVRDNRVSQ